MDRSGSGKTFQKENSEGELERKVDGGAHLGGRFLEKTKQGEGKSIGESTTKILPVPKKERYGVT